ncbi:MAG: D-amino acid dehydrogenase [Rhizobiales bacterium]|nr:D-amino acid dehydrogenase [Hyphomicrobiales bacterium]
MRVIICGAGIIGVTAAYELSRKGFDVIVIDRRDGPARETSAGNAGVIAPGYVTPWAAPGMPGKALKYLGQPAAPIIFRPRASFAQWRWIIRWLKNCNAASYRVNKPRSQRVAFYARERLHQARAALGVDYDASQGYLQLFRTAADQALAAPAIAILREAGIAHQLLPPDMCLAIEPGLIARDAPLHSGLFLPDDEAGDCALFAERMTAHLRDEGVMFRFDAAIESIQVRNGRAAGVAVRERSGLKETLDADAVLLAAGVDSVALARPLGIDLPLYPVKGYSTTLRVDQEAFAPKAAMMDEAYKTAITRFGDRVRIAGTAELSDDDAATLRRTPCDTLLKIARDWFPRGVAIPMRPSFWVGRRPMTPDGPPILGPTPVAGLFLNLGHGSSGWAMSLGSAKVLADIIAGDAPEIDLEGLTLARYGA